MRVLVVGGGIGGPATALALHALGIDAAVCEGRADGGRGRGAFLTVMPMGIESLRSLGAEAAARSYGVVAGGIEVVDADGALVRRGDFATEEHVPFTVTRSDLAHALRERCRERGVPVHYGRRLHRLERTGTAVTAHFEDGTRERGDVVVGADGVHSRTRTEIDPDAPAPRPLDLTVVYGFDAELVDPPPVGWVRFCEGRAAFSGYKIGPDGSGWWFTRLTATAADRAGPQDPQRWKQRVLDAVAADRGPLAGVVRATGDEVLGIRTYDLMGPGHASTPRWHDDRAVLVGDAAHAADPATGHGASHALADALCLARSLASEPTPHAAFRAYEQQRRPPTEAEAVRSATTLSSDRGEVRADRSG